MWLEILKKEVNMKGPKQVAKELGLSRTAVDLVCQGKYPAGTEKIEKRIASIYGQDGNVACPILGLITPNRCVETWQRAVNIGMKVGNPETLRLYKQCLQCAIRG